MQVVKFVDRFDEIFCLTKRSFPTSYG